MNEKVDCFKVFKAIITDEGICFTFNMLDHTEIYHNSVVNLQLYYSTQNLSNGDWSMEHGYSEEAGLSPYPRRALLAGAENSLQVVLVTSKKNDIDQTCKNSIQGFRVMLHIPVRVPRPSQQYFMAPLNQVTMGAIQPTMITTSESVKNYNPERRQCFFPSERKLKYFKDYSSLNCKLECLTNYTLQRCGCVKYYMPRENTTKICGTGKWDCMVETERILQIGDLRHKIKEASNTNKSSGDQDDIPHCNCMPICTDITYNVEISQNNWEWFRMYQAGLDYELPYKETDFYLTGLMLYFKSSQFVASERNELYGPTDFLANFGGLLGLFTGFSVLSLMEAIYFLTVRLCCNSRLYGYWAGPET